MYKLPKMYLMFKEEGNKHQIYLYDDVKEEGEFNWDTWTREESETSAKHFQEVLNKIPETGEIELFINSNGGSVKEGTAIFNQLKRHKAHKTGYIDGVGHSIAFTILQACDWRIMGEGTSAMIHEMWVAAVGNADQLREEAERLDTLMQASRQLFMQRAKDITEEQLSDMMKKETILTPDSALQYGFIDEIGGRGIEIPTGPMQAAESIKDIRGKFQSADFEKELKAFKEIADVGKPSEPKNNASYMEAFFNIFSK